MSTTALPRQRRRAPLSHRSSCFSWPRSANAAAGRCSHWAGAGAEDRWSAGISLDVDVTPQQDAIFWNIRLPRIAGGAVGGARSGWRILQGVFSIPADPSLVGVSSGARSAPC
jgi:ABC-type Fe3+-siderophore transport system permease subunit